MPVMQSFAEIEPRKMKSVHQRGFHQARFVDGAARAVVGTCRPLDHPVEDLELAEFFLPGRNALGAQIIHKGLLAGSCTYSEQGAQVFIEQIPLLLKAVEPSLRLFL